MSEPTRIDDLWGSLAQDADEGVAVDDALDPLLAETARRVRALDRVPEPDPVRMFAIRAGLTEAAVPRLSPVAAGAGSGGGAAPERGPGSLPVTRVLVIARELLFRRGLVQCLSDWDEVFVAGSAGTVADGLRLAAEHLPHVVLIGTTLSDAPGLGAATEFRRRFPSIATIVVAAQETDDELFAAIRAGAAAYCGQDVEAEEIVKLIRRVARGEYLINENVLSRPLVASRILDQFRELSRIEQSGTTSPFDRTDAGAFTLLTLRELELLEWMAQGSSNRDLDLSDQTVKNHMTNILRKLAVNDRTQAVISALRHGWITTDEGDASKPSSAPDRAFARIVDTADLRLQQAISAAREDERRRIAREIHDGPVQVLSNAIFAVHTTEQIAKRAPHQVVEELAHLRELLKDGVAELRRFMVDLRPTMLQDLGLVPTLTKYVDDFSRFFARPVTLRAADTLPPLDKHQELAAFRITQEALQNIHKHAGQGAEAIIDLAVIGGVLTLTVADNGRGFDPHGVAPSASPAAGLRVMRERAEVAGGDLHVDSAPGQGTTITLRLPLGSQSRQFGR